VITGARYGTWATSKCGINTRIHCETGGKWVYEIVHEDSAGYILHQVHIYILLYTVLFVICIITRSIMFVENTLSTFDLFVGQD